MFEYIAEMNSTKELKTAVNLVSELLDDDSMACRLCGVEWGDGESRDKNHTKDCIVPKAERWEARMIKILWPPKKKPFVDDGVGI